MRKYLLLTSLFLGIAFDILFWKKVPGISFAIFVTLCLVSGYLLLRSQNFIPAQTSLLLLVPIIFFSVMTFIRMDPLTLFLNYIITLFSMAILVLTYRGGLWTSYSLSDYAVNMAHLIGSMLTLPWIQITNTGAQQKTSIGKRHQNNLWPILRGLMLAIPILFVFGALFSSSDLIFAQRLNDLLTNLNLQNLGEYIFRGSTILIITYFLVGIFSHAANRSQNEKLIGMDKPIVAPFLGFTEASIILGSVLLLFSAFVIIQFQYFFFGQATITLAGFTYSEYARRGFGELVAVAVFSLVLLQSLSAITKRETNGQNKSFSGLAIGLVALVVIILVSSFQRLFLYEAAYGFSRLRTYSHVFMIWLGILLVAVVIIEVFRRRRAFAMVALFALMGFTASLNILNVDAFIVHQNINRSIQGKELDIAYLAALTNDAVPTLVKDYSSSNLPPKIKDGIGAALVCLKVFKEADVSKTQFWQSFHLSDWNASRGFSKVRESLKSYQAKGEPRPMIIIGPNGAEYPCQESYLSE